jgi:hypothetical protein
MTLSSLDIFRSLIRLSSYHRYQQRRLCLGSGLAIRFTVFLRGFNFTCAVPATPVLRTHNTRVWHCLCYILATKECSSWTYVKFYHSNNGEAWAGYCYVALWRPDRCKNRMYGGFLFRIRSRSVTGLYCRETSNNYVPVIDSEHI